VGEVGVAGAIVDAVDSMKPGLKIIISSSTAAGFERAREVLGNRCGVIPCPVDFPRAVSRAAHCLSPRIFACIETELWPSMLETMWKIGASTVILNGRISSRSFPRYRRIRSVTEKLLGNFALICASSRTSAQRLKELGAPARRLMLTGNAKYEALLDKPDSSRAAAAAGLLEMEPGKRVLVAGSIRTGDETHIVEAWKILEQQYSDMHLVAVPRHLKNVPALQRLFKARDMPFILYSDVVNGKGAPARIILVDRIGPLFDLYSLASVAFVGGSFAPKGGQNLLEPAAWGCPVLYGPHTENFEDAAMALEHEGAGGMVQDGKMLAMRIHEFFAHENLAAERGRAARRALERLAQGAATRQAEAMLNLLNREHFPLVPCL
jgi:3-deoxy-D-manno-octulosonic-acid transferase